MITPPHWPDIESKNQIFVTAISPVQGMPGDWWTFGKKSEANRNVVLLLPSLILSSWQVQLLDGKILGDTCFVFECHTQLAATWPEALIA